MVAFDVMAQPASRAAPVATFTMSLGPGSWTPGPMPAAGDVVILIIEEPRHPVAGPPDWYAAPGGRAFWKIWGPREELTVTFSAPGALAWRVKGSAYAAGSYEPRPRDHRPGLRLACLPAPPGQSRTPAPEPSTDGLRGRRHSGSRRAGA